MTGVHPLGRMSPAEMLSFLASAEQGSEHVLGRAIVQYAKDVSSAAASPASSATETKQLQDVSLFAAEQFEASPGRGIRCVVNGHHVQVRSQRFRCLGPVPFGRCHFHICSCVGYQAGTLEFVLSALPAESACSIVVPADLSGRELRGEVLVFVAVDGDLAGSVLFW